MSKSKKRAYNSEGRLAQAQETKGRILEAAKKLFQIKGLENTTIEMIAKEADVAGPTIYAAFKSKEGILKELVNVTLFGADYQTLVEKIRELSDPVETLRMAAKITRIIYDADKNGFELSRSSSAFSPAIRKIEKANEQQRYERQEVVILRLSNSRLLPRGMKAEEARDILWTLTDRELYRKLVHERGWSPDAYEKWLGRTLIQVLIADAAK